MADGDTAMVDSADAAVNVLGVPAKLAMTVKLPAAGKVSAQVATPSALVGAVQDCEPEVMVTVWPGTGVPGSSSRVALIDTAWPARVEMAAGRDRVVGFSETTVTETGLARAGASAVEPEKLAVTVSGPAVVNVKGHEADPLAPVVPEQAPNVSPVRSVMVTDTGWPVTGPAGALTLSRVAV